MKYLQVFRIPNSLAWVVWAAQLPGSKLDFISRPKQIEHEGQETARGRKAKLSAMNSGRRVGCRHRGNHKSSEVNPYSATVQLEISDGWHGSQDGICKLTRPLHYFLYETWFVFLIAKGKWMTHFRQSVPALFLKISFTGLCKYNYLKILNS